MSPFPHAPLVLGLLLALATAVAFNWSLVAQHAIASRMPRLEARRPLRSLRTLFSDPGWTFAFFVGVAGWALYVLALRLAPLSLVQSVAAAGIALLALFAQRASGERLPRREWLGVGCAVAGLVFLSASLAHVSTTSEHAGSWPALAAWFVLSWGAVALLLGPASPRLAPGAAWGLAAGLAYAAADVGTKAAVGGGPYVLVVLPVLACHGLAFATIQMGFQRGRALATAGLSTFCTNALPIAGGILVFREHVPGGALGVLRVLAFACVVVGAVVVARRGRVAETRALPLRDLEHA